MSIELQARVELLEKTCRALQQRIEELERSRVDAMDDYLDRHFPMLIPKVEQFLSDSGYAQRGKGKKGASTE